MRHGDAVLFYRGYFEAAHLFSGRFVVGVMATESCRPSSFALSSDYELSFVGQSTEGWDLRTIGPTFPPNLLWVLPTVAGREFFAIRVEARHNRASTDGYSKARFLVSNFLWHDSSDNDPETIRLEARGYQVVVEAVDNHDEVANSLVSDWGMEPTAWIEISCPQGVSVSLSDFSELVDDLVYMFRLVTGNGVDWYYGEAANDSDGTAVERIHKYIAPSRYTNTIIFRPRRADTHYSYSKLELDQLTAAFLNESGYTLEPKVLRELINRFTAACDNTAYLELGGLLASTLSELIVAKYAHVNGITQLVSRSKYKSQILPDLKAVIEEAELSEDEKKGLLDHLIGGYRSSFRYKLEYLAHEFSLPLDESRISTLVRTRNSLVHDGTYDSESQDGWYSDYQLFMWTNLVILCRLLGYEGELPALEERDSIEV